MAGGLDKLKKKFSGGGAADLGWLGLSVALAGSESKLKAIARAVKDIAIWRLVGAAGVLGGMLLGIRGTIKTLVRESGALEASVNRLSRIKVMQDLLRPFLGSVGAARTRLAQLYQLAARSPFHVAEWVQASRALAILSRGALVGTDSVKLMAKASEASGNNLVDAGLAAGEFYRALQDGVPVTQAADSLQRMGVISEQTVRELERMERTGGTVEQMWLKVTEAINGMQSPTKNVGSEIARGTKDLITLRDTMLSGFGKPFLKAEAQGIEYAIRITQNLIPVMQSLGRALADVVSVGSNIAGAIGAWATSFESLAAIVGTVTRATTLLIGLGIVAWMTAWGSGISALAGGLAWLNGLLASSGLLEMFHLRACNLLTVAEEARRIETIALANAIAALTVADEAAAAAAMEAADAQAAAALSAEAAALRYARASTGVAGMAAVAGNALKAAAMAAVRFVVAYSPIILTAVILGALWQRMSEHNAAVEALEAQEKAARDAAVAMDALIDKVENLDDAAAALEKLTAMEGDAKKELDDWNKEHAKDEKGLYNLITGKSEDAADQRRIREARVAEIQEKKAKLAAKPTGMSKEQQTLEESRAGRLVNLNRVTAADASRLTGYENARAQFNAQSKLIKAGGGTEEEQEAKIRAARLATGDEVLKAEQQVADLRKAGASGELIQAAERRSIFMKQAVEKRGEAFRSWEESDQQPGVSSLQRIGGGGGVGDPVTSLLEKQRALAEQQAASLVQANAYLAKIAGGGDGAPNQPGDIARPGDEGGYPKY